MKLKLLILLLSLGLAGMAQAQLTISPATSSSDGTLTPRNTFEFVEEFASAAAFWLLSAGGESAPGVWDGEPGHIGMARMTTGSGATNRSLLNDGHNGGWIFSGGEAIFETVINITTLSDGTETYTLRLGWVDSGTADGADGVFFRYTHSVNSGNWQLVARNNSVETATNSSTAVTAGAWQRLTIVVNAAGTSAEFFVNGVSIGTAASNIPVGAGRVTALYINLTKSAGTTARTVFVDYVYAKKSYSTPR